MPMRSDRMKRGRIRGRRSELLDWFAEDPWAEPGSAAGEDMRDEWNASLLDPSDEETRGDDVGEWDDDEYDGWGPVRPRRRHLRDAR